MISWFTIFDLFLFLKEFLLSSTKFSLFHLLGTTYYDINHAHQSQYLEAEHIHHNFSPLYFQTYDLNNLALLPEATRRCSILQL